jgi:acyl-CoA synthetase (AMP-forming)/AMP-acid ligase II
MTGYANEEELTNMVLRNGFVYTNDKGFIDSEGRLQLTGRNDDIINVGGFKVNPSEVENVALSFPDISDCICIADKHPVLGTTLRLLVVMHECKTLDKRKLAHTLLEKLEKYKVPQLYKQVESIKRTYNGKLDRKYYREDREMK